MKKYKAGDIFIIMKDYPGEERAKIYWDALGYMQSYNRRSKIDCVALALGLVIVYDEDDEKYYMKPELEKS